MPKRTVALVALPALAASAVIVATQLPGTTHLADAGVAHAAVRGVNGPIAFRRFFDQAHRKGAIFLINPDGGGEHQITHPPSGALDSQNGPPSFSPDGSTLVFTRSSRAGDAIWRVNADGSGEKRLSPPFRYAHPRGGQTNHQNAEAVYAPRGRLIAFHRADPPLKHHNLRESLRVMRTDGTHVRRILDVGYDGALGRIAWSPDGRRLAFERVRLDGKRPPAGALFVISARGGTAHRISRWRSDAELNSLDWSPDGARLLVQWTSRDSSFGGDYYTVRPDGSGLQRLSHFGAKAQTGAARWSPDGSSIVFANKGVDGNDDIYVMRADGTGITPVTQTPAWESAPAWGAAR